MTKEYTWQLNGTVVDSYTDAEGNTYSNVIEEIHWRCKGVENDVFEEVYGSVSLPKPTNPVTYIDLNEIVGEGVTPEAKSATILGWAEALEPGFKATVESTLASKIDAKAVAPVTTNISIL